MKARYIGACRWDYWLDGRIDRPADGTIELPRAEGNYADDELMARHYLRAKLKVKRLPKGAVVVPSRLA
jgi:hypothetical protein